MSEMPPTTSGDTGSFEAPRLAHAGLKPPGSAMIVFDKVHKYYPETDSVGMEDVSVRIDKGEFVFVVGHSGSGKSTFIRLLIKEIEADSGKIMVGGRTLSTLRRKKIPLLRRNIGCVFQDYKLLPNRTVFENVAYALQVTGGSKSEIRRKVPEIIHLVGLERKIDSYPDELSGGEQQRVSIARAFVNYPPLLLADEPTGNLDPDTSMGIMELLQRINRTGTTVVIATHDVAIVDAMRRRVLQLEGGHLIRDQHRAQYDDAVADELGLSGATGQTGTFPRPGGTGSFPAPAASEFTGSLDDLDEDTDLS